MKTITLTSVYRTNKAKDGTLLMGKNGKNYERLGIKCQEYGDTWLSGFGGFWNQDWSEGDKVNVEIKEVKSGDKVYINFEKVDENKILEERIKKLEDVVFGVKTMTPVKETSIIDGLEAPEMPPQADVNVDDIPF